MTENVETLPFVGNQEHFLKKKNEILLVGCFRLKQCTVYTMGCSVSKYLYRTVSISEDIFNSNYSCLITVQCIYRLHVVKITFFIPVSF